MFLLTILYREEKQSLNNYFSVFKMNTADFTYKYVRKHAISMLTLTWQDGCAGVVHCEHLWNALWSQAIQRTV